MQVFLPAIEGHVPPEMVHCIAIFLNICYTIRGTIHTTMTINKLEKLIAEYHTARDIFIATVRPAGISLPRQHALVHYPHLIREFGAPNGLCSSITETRHISAVKEPYRRSNHHEPLAQMLIANTRTDKIGAARAVFKERGMLDGDMYGEEVLRVDPARIQEGTEPHQRREEDDDGGPVNDPSVIGKVELARTRCMCYPPFL